MLRVLCASDISFFGGILDVSMVTCKALQSYVLISERGFLAKVTNVFNLSLIVFPSYSGWILGCVVASRPFTKACLFSSLIDFDFYRISK